VVVSFRIGIHYTVPYKFIIISKYRYTYGHKEMSRRKTSFVGRINNDVGFLRTPLATLTIKYFIGMGMDIYSTVQR